MKKKLRKGIKRTNVSYDDFKTIVGAVKHELRNPLIDIGAHAKLIERKASSREVRKLARKIQPYIKRLEGFLTNAEALFLLDEVGFDTSEYDLWPDIIEPAVESCEPLLKERGAIPYCNKNLLRESKIITNAELLQTLYENLISNAARYGKEGGKVIFGKSNFVDDPGLILLNVRNDGYPLKPKLSKRMFNKDERGDFTETMEGMGFGLYISKRIIEGLGGEIWAEPGRKYGVNIQFTHPRYEHSGFV